MSLGQSVDRLLLLCDVCTWRPLSMRRRKPSLLGINVVSVSNFQQKSRATVKLLLILSHTVKMGRARVAPRRVSAGTRPLGPVHKAHQSHVVRHIGPGSP